MKFTKKLLAYLHKPFDKDPHKFLAIRLQYQGGMTWQVSDGFLYTTVSGGTGHNLTVDLSQYTVAQLVAFLAAQPGYSVPYFDTSNLSTLKALVLMDGANDISTSNGDHLYGYTNPVWSYMDSQSNELAQAQTQIGEMLKQMSTTTALGEWLDLLGAYFGIPRLQGELDANYGPRIIMEVLRPRGNNVAIEVALAGLLSQPVTITDTYLATNSLSPEVLGLFDAVVGYNLLGSDDLAGFANTVKTHIETLRDAGTHLNSLAVTGSVLTDSPPNPATDDGPNILLTIGLPLTDSAETPTDSASFTWVQDTLYDGVRNYDGSVTYNSGEAITETLQG